MCRIRADLATRKSQFWRSDDKTGAHPRAGTGRTEWMNGCRAASSPDRGGRLPEYSDKAFNLLTDGSQIHQHALRLGDGLPQIACRRKASAFHFGSQITGRRRTGLANRDRLRVRLENLTELLALPPGHNGDRVTSSRGRPPAVSACRSPYGPRNRRCHAATQHETGAGSSLDGATAFVKRGPAPQRVVSPGDRWIAVGQRALGARHDCFNHAPVVPGHERHPHRRADPGTPRQMPFVTEPAEEIPADTLLTQQ